MLLMYDVLFSRLIVLFPLFFGVCSILNKVLEYRTIRSQITVCIGTVVNRTRCIPIDEIAILDQDDCLQRLYQLMIVDLSQSIDHELFNDDSPSRIKWSRDTHIPYQQQSHHHP